MYRWLIVALVIFGLVLAVSSAQATPCPWAPDDCEMILVQQVFLPLVVKGAVAASTPTPAITPTPRLPAPGITPRADR